MFFIYVKNLLAKMARRHMVKGDQIFSTHPYLITPDGGSLDAHRTSISKEYVCELFLFFR